MCCAQVHFISVCVKGIGESTTRELWKRGWLNSPAGLYSVTKVGAPGKHSFPTRHNDVKT